MPKAITRILLRRSKNFWGFCLVLFFGGLIGTFGQDNLLLPPGLYLERLENPGLAIQTARLVADDPTILPFNEETRYLEVAVKSLYFLELNQDYTRALSLLIHLDSLKVTGSTQYLTPYFGDTTWGLLSMRIPEYYVSLGDFSLARQWLSQRIPGLTDTREIHFAALVLGRILTLEGRYDQAIRLLETRFFGPLRIGDNPPFAEKALVTGVDLYLEAGRPTEANELRSLAQGLFPESMETLLLRNVSDVNALPVPGTLLAGSEVFSLGLVELRPVIETQDPVTPEVGQAEGYIQIGSFSSRENAQRYESLTREKGFEVLLVQGSDSERVRLLVPVDDRGSTTLLLLLREAGIEGFFVNE